MRCARARRSASSAKRSTRPGSRSTSPLTRRVSARVRSGARTAVRSSRAELRIRTGCEARHPGATRSPDSLRSLHTEPTDVEPSLRATEDRDAHPPPTATATATAGPPDRRPGLLRVGYLAARGAGPRGGAQPPADAAPDPLATHAPRTRSLSLAHICV